MFASLSLKHYLFDMGMLGKGSMYDYVNSNVLADVLIIHSLGDIKENIKKIADLANFGAQCGINWSFARYHICAS